MISSKKDMKGKRDFVITKPTNGNMNFGDWAAIIQGYNTNPDILSRIIQLDSKGEIALQNMIIKMLRDMNNETQNIYKENKQLIEVINGYKDKISFLKKYIKGMK